MNKILRLLLLPCLLLTGELNAQNTYPAAAAQMEFLGKSQSLRQIQAASTFDRTRTSKSKLRQEVPKEIPNFTGAIRWPNDFADVALPKGQDPLAARPRRGANLDIEPQVVIEGTDRPLAGGVSPPDPACDVSPKHFIQLTNARGGTYMRVFDLEGNNVFNLSSLNFLWAQFNANGLGDPIVLYDQAAGRWFISEFQDFGGNALLIAVSETDDPTGSWFAYRVQTPSFPDYPKYSIWPNAYLVTTNEGGDPNIPIYALERGAMLNGQSNAGIQRLGIPKFGAPNIWQTAQPVDWDGFNAPPDGTPGYVVRMYDDSWQGGQDKVEMWEVHIDWADSNNSFTSGPIDIFSAPFKSSLCAGSFFDCIPQPNNVRVDALQQIILHRVPYLNFSSYEAITLHFAVDADGNNRAGLRWMELRRTPGEEWSLFQEGTYAPEDGHHRFAGAISMDYNGNILMAYTTGGPDKNLSLRFTGRLANDPLGEMTINEYEFAEGLSSQNGSRWGDYAAMSVNPANGTDFWFVGEYMKANGAWGTKAMMARIRRDTNDVGPQALLAPRTSGYLTDAEPIQVAVRNYGYSPQTDLGISYRFNGGAAVNELITDTIPPDSVYIHTFATTEDLSAIGSYEFMIYTTLPTDTAFFNDTLRARVLQLPRNDAALAGFDGLLSTVCDSFATVDIRFRNAGVDTLYSLNIIYQLNDEQADTILWAGSLAPGGQDFITLQFGPLEEGPQNLTASTYLPNGLPDENIANDGRAASFNILLDGKDITLRMRTDSWPEETTWELRDEDDNLLFSGGPYSEENTLFLENWCLAEGCYILTIFDSYGDGLIGPPPGSVQVVNEDDIILAGLGGINFGSRYDLEFCTEAICLLEISADIRNESAPDAADGRIIMSVLNGVPPYQYSLDGGETFQSSPVFAGLANGDYQAAARDGRNCRTDSSFTIQTCLLEIAAEVINAIEGQNNGAISISVNGGEGPFTYILSGIASQDSSFFTNLPPGDYTLTVRDEATGCTRQLSLTVDVIVSVGPPVFFGMDIKLFPNPTEGFVRVEIRGLKHADFVPVKVYDASGQLVRHARLVTYGESAQGVVSLYGLPSGTYYLRFVDEALTSLYPVVKQ